MQKYQSKVDVAVLLLFFTRPTVTKEVFNAIKRARPSKLFLYQDGPRNGKNDMPGILECRKIVEDIDWECEVHKKYLENNDGCDPSGYRARKWMFSMVDKGIVLEDDCVPAQSFFPFCKELLDRYENDTRIGAICGMNNLGVYECGDQDYFFTNGGSICGIAYWKRVIDGWNPGYDFLEDKYACSLLEDSLGKSIYSQFIKTCKKRSKGDIDFFESIQGQYTHLQGLLNIVPTKNMICNIGVTENATHSTANILDLPRAVRKIFNMKVYELNFPIRHPKYISNDRKFRKKVERNMYGNVFVRFFKLRKIESLLNRYFPFFSRL